MCACHARAHAKNGRYGAFAYYARQTQYFLWRIAGLASPRLPLRPHGVNPCLLSLLSNIPYQPSLKEEDLTKEDIEELENFFEQLPN
jgi:hypothetical protein